MTLKFIILGSSTLAALIVWFASNHLDQPYLAEIYQTLLWFSIWYLLLKIIAGQQIARHYIDVHQQYRFRKSISIVFYVFFLLTAFYIWIEDPQTLLIGYGVVAAGAAIALQDLIKNLAGGVLIISKNIYTVGDRVEIDGIIGDVIDIGLINSTFMELNQWVDGNQATGRIVAMPNGILLSRPVKNFTKDHDFLWDEIGIPVTYGSDWRKAADKMQEIVEEITAKQAEEATKRMRKLATRYYYIERHTKPSVYITATDNWIMLNARFVSGVRGRRLMRTQVHRKIMEFIEDEPNIEIASATQEIVGFPELEVVNRKK